MLHCWGYSRLIGKLFELFSNNILCTCVMTADFWNISEPNSFLIPVMSDTVSESNYPQI